MAYKVGSFVRWGLELDVVASFESKQHNTLIYTLRLLVLDVQLVF